MGRYSVCYVHDCVIASQWLQSLADRDQMGAIGLVVDSPFVYSRILSMSGH